MTLFLRCDSDSGGGGRGDEPEGRSGGNFSNPERGGGEGRKGQSDGGRAGFCLAGHALAGKTAGGVGGVWGMRKETRTAAFSSQGARRDPFISLIMRRDCCFCQSPLPPRPSMNNSRPHNPQHLNFSPSCLLPFTSTITAANRDINQERWQLMSR